MRYIVIPAVRGMAHLSFDDYDSALDCALDINDKHGCSVFVMHKNYEKNKWVTDFQIYVKETC